MSVLTIAISILLGLPTALAGAGASVHGCIYQAIDPPQPLTVKWYTHMNEDHCMNDRGHNGEMVISKQGVECADLGYVEAKMSSSNWDTCATDKSRWRVLWQKADQTWQGQVDSIWRNAPGVKNDWEIELHSEAGSGQDGHYVSVCRCSTWGSKCTEKTTQWSNTGDLCIVFYPKGLMIDAEALEVELDMAMQERQLEL